MIQHEQLPPLNGSAVQVAWAEYVRAEKVAEMERYADTVVARHARHMSAQDSAALRRRIIKDFAPILARRNASYWINLAWAARDTRSATPSPSRAA